MLCNSTGPFEVADHVARYILQEALQLSPKVDVIGSAISEGKFCCDKLHIIEKEDELEEGPPDEVMRLAGTYLHSRFEQKITISVEGHVYIHGNSKTSSPMRVAYCRPDVIRIIPGARGFGIDRWGEWNDLEFIIKEVNGKRSLVGSQGQHIYILDSSGGVII